MAKERSIAASLKEIRHLAIFLQTFALVGILGATVIGLTYEGTPGPFYPMLVICLVIVGTAVSAVSQAFFAVHRIIAKLSEDCAQAQS